MTEEERLRARQQVVALLEQRTPDDVSLLRDAGTQLAGALRRLADDQKVWDDVAEANGLVVTTQVDLELLARVDWTKMLTASSYRPPPPPDWMEAELLRLTAQVAQRPTPAAADELRTHVRWLADSLSHDVSEPLDSAHGPRGRRLLRKIGHGLNVLRRIDIGVLVFTMGREAFGAVIEGVPDGLTGIAVGAAAAAALAKAVLDELREAKDRTASAELEPVDDLFGRLLLDASAGRLGQFKEWLGWPQKRSAVAREVLDVMVAVNAVMPSVWAFLLGEQPAKAAGVVRDVGNAADAVSQAVGAEDWPAAIAALDRLGDALFALRAAVPH